MTGTVRGFFSKLKLKHHYLDFFYFYFSRKNPLGLIVALSDNGTAEGSLFWDDGDGVGKVKGWRNALPVTAAPPKGG